MLRCWEGGCHYRPFHVIAEVGLHGTAKLHLCSSPFFEQVAFLLLKIYESTLLMYFPPISMLCELIKYVALLRVQPSTPDSNRTPTRWILECPFWKMKPSTSGLPCIKVLV